MNTVAKLYTRKGCHLCDKAKKILLELKETMNFQLEEIDIEQSDDLIEKYGLMIPVVVIDGKEVQYGQIDKQFISMYLSEKIKIK